MRVIPATCPSAPCWSSPSTGEGQAGSGCVPELGQLQSRDSSDPNGHTHTLSFTSSCLLFILLLVTAGKSAVIL